MKKLMIYSFTESGTCLNAELSNELTKKGYECESYAVSRFAKQKGLRELERDWKEKIGKHWGEYALFFIGAAGIAIRTVAPWIQDKFTDPPVVVMDEKGKFVIPLLSGHVGGAVELAELTALSIGAVPVITTATDVQQKFAVDVFATRNHLVITDRVMAKKISAGILEGKKVGIVSDFPVIGEVPDGLVWCRNIEDLKQYTLGIVICQRMPGEIERLEGILYLLPQNVYLGVGSRRGIEKELFLKEMETVLKRNNMVQKQVCAVGSIDLKKDEEGILEFAALLKVPFYTYPAEELKEIRKVSSRSAFVEQAAGVDNVCERAAYRMCPKGSLVQEKICMERCTAAIVCGKIEIDFS